MDGLILTITFTGIPAGWKQDSSRVTLLGEFDVYRDENDDKWYVPYTTERCLTCDGKGYMTSIFDEDDDEPEPCYSCDGSCYENISHVDQMMSENDYLAVVRQHYWINKRYGHMPQHITDYWVSAS